jgi:hypothetical protein
MIDRQTGTWNSVRVVTLKVGLLAISVLGAHHAQGETSPARLAQAVVDAFCAGSEDDFASIYPFREGRASLSMALKAKAPREPGLATVVRASGSRALVIVSAVPAMPNSGDATLAGSLFSGLYDSRPGTSGWYLHSRIPLDKLGTIKSHHVRVAVRPASGLQVEDRMQIAVQGPNGFAVRLNHRAVIRQVRTAKGPSTYRFGGGLLWVDLPPGIAALTLIYTINVEHDGKDSNSGLFLEHAGHVRSQYFWHPFFDFRSEGDRAHFEVEARIPREYQLSTSLPQTSRLDGNNRFIFGKTVRPTMALSLIYDRDWQPVSHQIGDVRLDLLLTADMRSHHEDLVNEFRVVHQILSSRFGPVPGRTVTVVEARSMTDNPGWRFASNQIVVTAGRSSLLSVGVPYPMAPFGHEVSHLWMDGATGAGMNFLTEGWATYAESLVVSKHFGQEAANAFWRVRADVYMHALDGKANLLEDDANAGIAYFKGAWIFRMLEDAIGTTAFDNALTDFSHVALSRRSGWELLAQCAQRHVLNGADVRSYLLPWLSNSRAPRLSAEVRGSVVTLLQEQPYFNMPVMVAASTANGREMQRVWVGLKPTTTLKFFGKVADVQIDPDQRLLLRSR